MEEVSVRHLRRLSKIYIYLGHRNAFAIPRTAGGCIFEQNVVCACTMIIYGNYGR
jgi:hypothetical protein